MCTQLSLAVLGEAGTKFVLFACFYLDSVGALSVLTAQKEENWRKTGFTSLPGHVVLLRSG